MRKQKKKDRVDVSLIVVKCKLRTIVRKKYRNILLPIISKISIEATKIAALGSLLFLTKMQNAYNQGRDNSDFFLTDGEKLIRKCFHAVAFNQKRKLKVPLEFRQFIDTDNPIEWPRNDYFGNNMNFLCDTFFTNVKNNLNVHLEKRLLQFLRMKVYKLNQQLNAHVFDDLDITNTIKLAIGEPRNITDQQRRGKCEYLMEIIRDMSWFEIANDNVKDFTKKFWMCSITLWLAMQREIEEFNVDAENREERRGQRQEYRKQKHQKDKQNPDENKPPFIKNLVVIPICSFARSHIMIDNYTLYKLMCASGLMPKDKGGMQLPSTEITSNKDFYWNQLFFLRKIHRFKKKKSIFHYEIVTDGVGVSVLYGKSKNSVGRPLTREEIMRKYLDGEFVFELGIDPGLKTWNATVRRTIATGKEARHPFNLHFAFVLSSFTS